MISPGNNTSIVCTVLIISAENINTSYSKWTEQAILRNICVYTFMHAITIIEEKGHGFKAEQGRLNWREWRKERENVIT